MSRYTREEIENYQIRAERAEKRLGEAVELLKDAVFHPNAYSDRLEPRREELIKDFIAKIEAECEVKPDGRVVDRKASARCGASCVDCGWRCEEPKGHPLEECFRCKCPPRTLRRWTIEEAAAYHMPGFATPHPMGVCPICTPEKS